ncbi:MAG: PBSX family phage terminase large subunit [Peptostreptococcaceae bacterium]|nr:PBSX family phage terminase large subunit [Peptostreptococcaceae bacterium]MDY5738679.1 PBSX family phage terminase large subunit [Anaerovoracaceae bacterium]
MGRIAQVFKFKPFSKKQKRILTWWLKESPVHDKNGIIADGAIRSGKTVSMALSFIIWSMESFEGESFGMAGKTIGAFRRNVLKPLKLMLIARGYKYKDRRADNLLEISRNGVTNYFYIFGGKDERSQDLVQGITLAGFFFDEVALMPESFVNQATARCSVEGSKWWFNCNPDKPKHWFKVEWIDKAAAKELLYLHFTMDDNLSLSESIKERYKSQFIGVFFKRFIQGLWVAAEGLVHPQFANNAKDYAIDYDSIMQLDSNGKRHNCYGITQICIGIDIGGTKSHTPFIATGFTAGFNKQIRLYYKRIQHSKGTVDPDKIYATFKEFVAEVRSLYPGIPITAAFVDNAEQLILNGLAMYSASNGIGVSVTGCHKTEFKDRVLAYNAVINTNKLLWVKDFCEPIADSLAEMVYDSKSKEEKLLDDFTTDVDTYDADFYSWSHFINYFHPIGGRK